jgi:hypothetical protein
MRRLSSALAFAVISAAAGRAMAGETACWVDNGAVVTSAALGDIAGDFILDLSAPHSQLHLTTAQGDGLGDAASTQDTLRLAGERIAANFAVADLDDRSWDLPTNISGVIGADVLAGYVVELRFAPCRLTLSRRAASRPALATLPVELVDGTPTVAAGVSDGAMTLTGRFAIDTGAAGVRVSAGSARFSRLSARVDPMSRDRPPARLAMLMLAGATRRDEPAALQTDLPAGVLGGIGTNVWTHYVLRLDLRRDQLELISPDAVSARRSARAGGSSRRAGG